MHKVISTEYLRLKLLIKIGERVSFAASASLGRVITRSSADSAATVDRKTFIMVLLICRQLSLLNSCNCLGLEIGNVLVS